jgi:hypothetical protein
MRDTVKKEVKALVEVALKWRKRCDLRKKAFAFAQHDLQEMYRLEQEVEQIDELVNRVECLLEKEAA